ARVRNAVPEGAERVAPAYAGHPFGGFPTRPGDGRALLLGEVVGGTGERRDLHLKGSGRTPFARGGDGLATVGPMLREHIMCAAMHALGVATTRGLAVVATGDAVRRETMLPGAVFVRVASSHLRVGTFQYAAGLDDPALLERLVDHAIARHHRQAAHAEVPALALLDAVSDAQARLVASWMNLGFVHGVMNTDNTTISGETIDYGPCAFLDAYDPAAVFSSIDHGGRYAYGNQPGITQWNLARLAEPLLALIDADVDRAIDVATALLGEFPERYAVHRAAGLAAKLGLDSLPVDDDSLGDDLMSLMHAANADFTATFRSLSDVVRGDDTRFVGALSKLASSDVEEWLARFRDAHAASGHETPAAMDAVNPIYIPRNHLVEEALAAAVVGDQVGDLGPFEQLMDVLADPFTERPGLDRYAAPAPADFLDGYQTFCGT
ncbi:MAG: YdiU family protein, partial [Ilumatobacter sp.]